MDIYALDEQTLSVRGNIVHLFSERDPAKVKWKGAGADYVVESTGSFTTNAAASAHIQHGGAKKVLISAPSKDSPTFVCGVNAHEYPIKRPNVISCASCTTNCLAPLAKVLNDKFIITQALMTTVHASTRSQYVLDGYSKRDRRAGKICAILHLDNGNRVLLLIYQQRKSRFGKCHTDNNRCCQSSLNGTSRIDRETYRTLTARSNVSFFNFFTSYF
jgi:glyceraldehyde-3-phosphate dehydrogenase type I